jgi:hypothetical protein
MLISKNSFNRLMNALEDDRMIVDVLQEGVRNPVPFVDVQSSEWEE